MCGFAIPLISNDEGVRLPKHYRSRVVSGTHREMHGGALIVWICLCPKATLRTNASGSILNWPRSTRRPRTNLWRSSWCLCYGEMKLNALPRWSTGLDQLAEVGGGEC